MEHSNIAELQNHQQIAHIKPRIKKLEELSHGFDKTIDSLIEKQQVYVDRLNQLSDGMAKIMDRLSKIELQNEREAGKREFLSRIFNSKPFFFCSIALLMVFFSNDHDSIIQALINKVF